MRVAVYARNKNQKEELLNRASRECWEYDYFEEKETSRKTRPVKYQLYKQLLKKKYDAIIVWQLDCWAQSLVELITEIDMLYTRDVKFITLKNSIDLTNELAFCQYHTIHDFAEFQRSINATKIKDSFYTDKDGITRSKKTKKCVGKRGPDRRKRKTAGYHKRIEEKR